MKVLALVPYPIDKGPSQRFRLGLYLPYLKEFDIEMDCHPFYNDRAWDVLYKKGKVLSKMVVVIFGFCRRLILLFRLNSYDCVYVQRER